MPITRSAKKKLRQDKKRQSYNLLAKKSVKEIVKSFRKKPTGILLPKVFSILDTAAKKKIFHANKVARLKSNLSKLISDKTTVKPFAKVTKGIKKTKTTKKSS